MTDKQLGLRFGPLGEGAMHLCVDMQQMFDADTPWATGWLRKVLPQVSSSPCPWPAVFVGKLC